MTRPHPSRFALAVLSLVVPDDDPLTGDLLEEFQARQSQWWLWRQVAGALLSKRLFRRRLHQPLWISLVGVVLLVVMSFEMVFATNVIFRLLFGPPPQDVAGFLYLLHRQPPIVAPSSTMALRVWLSPVLAALTLSIAVGWWLVRRVERPSRVLLCGGVAMWTVVNMSLPFAAQFLSTLALVVGFVVGSRLTVTTSRTPLPLN